LFIVVVCWSYEFKVKRLLKQMKVSEKHFEHFLSSPL